MISDLTVYSYGDLLVVGIADFILRDQIGSELIPPSHILSSAEAANEFWSLNVAGGNVVEDAETCHGLPVISVDNGQFRFNVQT